MKRVNAYAAEYLQYLTVMNEASGNLIQRLKKVLDIPRLSPATQTYLTLATQPNPDIGTVADALANDPNATERIIELANSDLFTRHRHSSNLQQALANLGSNEALILNVACEVFSALHMMPAGNIDRNAFEQRALIAAAWGKTLGNEFGRRDSTRLMLAAMIQDIGVPLIAHDAPNTYANLDPLATERKKLATLESTTLNSNHRQVGAWLAWTWQLPDEIISTFDAGHDPATDDVAHQQRSFCRAVNLCGELADITCRPLTAEIVEQICAKTQRYLGIGPDRLGELFGSVAAGVASLGSILGFDSRIPTDYEAIARQVNALLPPSNVRTLPPPNTPTAREPVSKLLGPTSFTARLDEEFKLTARHDWPLSLLVIEIDDFKEISERHGPRSSAQMRDDVAALLIRNIRSSDAITALGEDRFAILLPGSDAEEAGVVAKRIVEGIRGNVSKDEYSGNFSVTASIGIATESRDTPFSRAPELSAAATVALEHSVNKGRDRQTAYVSIRAA